MLKLELIVNVPKDQVAKTKQSFEREGFEVVTKEQDSGTVSVAAAKFTPD